MPRPISGENDVPPLDTITGAALLDLTGKVSLSHSVLYVSLTPKLEDIHTPCFPAPKSMAIHTPPCQ